MHHRYHGKCLKIARGKIKLADKYTCPVCDWRVRIPRDAARPKLEDLIDLQHEIVNLPFQPTEEDVIEDVIESAQSFRESLRGLTGSDLTSSPENLDEYRFYLRKIEGAHVLLAYETNYLRQELHKWNPVAPEPPPLLYVSNSTRKPRPTKQQKLMVQLGINNPEDLPPQLRTKAHIFGKSKTDSTSGRPKPPHPLQPAPPLSKGSGTPSSVPLSAGSSEPSSAISRAHGQRPPFLSNASPDGTPTANPSIFASWRQPGSNADSPRGGLPGSPVYRPNTPPPAGASGPLDPSLFSPSTAAGFAAGALREGALANQSLHAGSLISPLRESYGVGHSHSHSNSGGTNNMDSLFANFTNDDDSGGLGAAGHEAEEALEGLGIVGGNTREGDVDLELDEMERQKRFDAEYLALREGDYRD